MKTQGMRKRGFTLVELLVVIAIIVILAAITLPTLINAGAFQKEYVSQSGRTLYNMLRSAEFYAATYNVETCLAYAAEVQVDSQTGLDAVIARSVGVFRRATDAELNRWASIHGVYGSGPLTPTPMYSQELNGDVPVFVPVAQEYDLTELRQGACVLGDWDDTVPAYEPFWGDPALSPLGFPAEGLTPVRIRTEEGPPLGFAPDPAYDGVLVAPNVPMPSAPLDDCWGAHVFSPAGYVVTDAPQERLVMNVGPTPWSDFDERFIDLNEVPDYPVPPGYTLDYYPVPTVPVQISKSSARIKLVEPD